MKSEKELRRWLKKEMGNKLFWIEHAHGGTVGLPDAFIVNKGSVTFLELKVGEVRDMGDELWVWDPGSMRPAQLAVMRRMMNNEVESNVLVGSTLGNGVFIADSLSVLKGVKYDENIIMRKVDRDEIGKN